jgi:exodeoxyribonuclease V beta subunit
MSPPLRYPRPPSLSELGSGHNVVESSAGTGKTYLLEHLFVDLILTHAIPADQILVVTFTEKATAELVLRLRRLIGELAELRPDHPQAVAAANAPAGAAWVIDQRARQLLGDARLAFDRIGIFTIHAFCQRVLREHAFVQGRLFDEELVGAETAFGEAFAEVLRTRVAADPSLTALLEAWLASGETVAGLEQLLLACDKAKAQALRPAFDEARLATALAAWQPVASGDEKLKGALKAAKVNGNTINAVVRHLAKLSESVAGCAGSPLRFIVETRDPKHADIAYVLERLAGQGQDRALAALESRLRELAAAAVPLEAVAAQRLLPIVQERAARGKRTAGRFDFEDMLELVDQALADPGPAGRALAASLRRRYQHALIDEFQDTDETQWSIFRRIFVAAGDHHALTVIGDPKQAIYGFRGANVFTYLEARRALQPGGKPSLVLDRNFRSTAELIAATNLIFDQRAEFFRPASGIVYDRPVQCGHPQRKLTGESGKPAAPVVIFGLETTGKSLKADDARAAVAAAMVAELHALLADDCPLRLRDGEQKRRVRARDVFILTFTNHDSQTIGRALAEGRIPHAFYKQDKLFETPEASEILDVLRALCAPEDRGLRARALLTRIFALDLPEVAAAAELGATAGPTQLMLHLAARARTTDIPALFASLVEDTGVLRRELFANAGERGLTNFTHVLELLQAEWARRHASLPELVDRLASYVHGTGTPPARDSDLQRLETDSDAVQILTVHKAKGLEADIVFLYGGTGEQSSREVRVIHEGSARIAWVGSLADPVQTRFEAEQHDERCRLLYVALTRARYRLYLPHYPPHYARLAGPYARLNRRLDEIVAGQPAAAFARRRVDCDATVPDAGGAAPVAPGQVQDVSALLAAPSVPAEVDEIRQRRQGFLVTSYTAVKRARAGLRPAEEAAERWNPGEHHTAETADRLPGGAKTGIFLHDILARVSLADLAAAPAFPAWSARTEVAALLERLRRRHDRPPSEIEPAARLVHTAYTAPVRLGESVIPGLAAAKSALRESEFLYPMPEPAHPLLSRPSGSSLDPSWKIERGAVKGFIDLLFEHEGRVYVCDWKSDLLPSYEAAALAHHCEEHYDVQARLYVIAALRLCGIADPAEYGRRFGAVLFCFLRGRRPGGEREGMHCFTPTWDAILAWETEMLGQPFWGLAR